MERAGKKTKSKRGRVYEKRGRLVATAGGEKRKPRENFIIVQTEPHIQEGIISVR
jgi:hypothetical protein